MVRWRALKPSQTFKRDCNPQILMVIMPLLFWVRLVISFASSFGPRALAMFQKSLPPRPSILRKSGRANEKKATEGYKQKKKKKEKKGRGRGLRKGSGRSIWRILWPILWNSIEDDCVSYCIRLLHMKCFFQVWICRADNARPTLSYCLLSIILENEKLTMIYIQEDS